MTRAALFVFAAVGLVACNENGLSAILPADPDLQPTILMDPDFIDFGLLEAGDEVVEVVTVTNIGTDVLRLTGTEYEGSASFTLVDADQLPSLLPAGDSVTFQVRFSPQGTGELTGQGIVLNNDPEDPRATVDMIGRGSGPALHVTPDPHDFNTVFVGCDDDVDVTLSNVGDADLQVTDLALDSPDGQFRITGGLPLPLTLRPGASASLTVEFDALRAGLSDAVLEVTSTDPRGVVYATQLGEGTYASQRVENFTMPTNPPVDIVFAIDQSCSMDAHSTNLGNNFSTLIQSLTQVTSNWQVGVVTLDSGCINDTIFTATTTNLVSRFQTAASQGGHGEWTEKLFILTQSALAKTTPGWCNHGLLRDDALLHVVLVSDEYEQSNISPGSFVTSVWGYKASPSQVRISSIVCPNSGCNWADGSNGGYAQATAQGGGQQLNILTTNWGASAQALAETSLSGIGRFPLSGSPDPNSMTVTVNGQSQPSGWFLDTTSNELVFTAMPPAGSSIQVTYGLLVACP